MFLIILSTQIVYARYVTTESLNITQEIATPIIQIKEGNIAQIDKINNIGYYEFSVINYKEDKISEINFKYKIEIVSELEDNLKYELYKDDQQIPITDSVTDEIIINKNEKIEHKYKLKIIYSPVVENKEDCIKNIKIKIHSEQEKI